MGAQLSEQFVQIVQGLLGLHHEQRQALRRVRQALGEAWQLWCRAAQVRQHLLQRCQRGLQTLCELGQTSGGLVERRGQGGYIACCRVHSTESWSKSPHIGPRLVKECFEVARQRLVVQQAANRSLAALQSPSHGV